MTMFIAARDIRREFGGSLFYQNAIFFPLAIIAGIHGDESPYLVYLFLFTIFLSGVFSSTYRFFFKTTGSRTNDKNSLFVRRSVGDLLVRVKHKMHV
jgi:predicted permease